MVFPRGTTVAIVGENGAGKTTLTQLLFRLLEPERIGAKLSSTFQIEPEQSTSAIIIHHPGAKYFVA